MFAKLLKKLSPRLRYEVFYQERELTEVQKILMSPDRSPNFRGARDMGVSCNGGFDALDAEARRRIIFPAAYRHRRGFDRRQCRRAETVRAALQKLAFLVVQDIRLTETAKLAQVVLPAAHFGEKEGTYTNRKGRVQKTQCRGDLPRRDALQDSEIFIRLLEARGRSPYLFDAARNIHRAEPRK